MLQDFLLGVLKLFTLIECALNWLFVMVCNCGDSECSCYESCSCVAALCLCVNCMKIRLKLHDSSTGSQQGRSEDSQNFRKFGSASNSKEIIENSSKIKTGEETHPIHDATSQGNATNISRSEAPDKTFSRKILQLVYKQGLKCSRSINDMSKAFPTSSKESSSKKDSSSIQTGTTIIRKRSQPQNSLGSSEKGAISPAKKYKPQSSERELQSTSVPPNFSTPLSSISSSLPSTFSSRSPTPSTSKAFIFKEERSGSDDTVDIETEKGDSSSDALREDAFGLNATNIYGDDKRNLVRDPNIASSINNTLNNPLDSLTNEQTMEGFSLSMLEKLQELSSKPLTLTEREQGMALSILQSIRELDQPSTSNQMDNSNNSDETK